MLQGCFSYVTTRGRVSRLTITTALGFLYVGSAMAQSPTPVPVVPPPKDTVAAAAKPSRLPGLKRWLAIEAFSVSARYRIIQNGMGDVTANQLQYQVAIRGRFKFDGKGRYSVVAGLYTGSFFNSGWNSTGLGTGTASTNLYLKHLYFDARPTKSLQFQIGGLGVNNGENTEATGYDNDAFIMGERIIIKAPKKLYFDEISVTNAHLGELNQPSVFRRFGNLSKPNYRQVLVRKEVNKRFAFSADYTHDSGTDTLRQAVRIMTPGTRLIDRVVFENYQRFNGPGRYGFNLFGERKLSSKVALNAGIAHIDAVMLNGDRFPKGTRMHATATYKPRAELTVTAAFTQGLGPAAPALPRTRFEIIFSYNILETLRRHRLH